jgi:hypothetical protein
MPWPLLDTLAPQQALLALIFPRRRIWDSGVVLRHV